MRRLSCLFAAALVLCLASPPPTAGDAADRAYILAKLQFVFLSNPNDKGTAAKIDAAKVVTDDSFYPKPGLTVFRDFIKALTSDKLAGGLSKEAQDRLQSTIALTLKVTDKPIRVVLVDDVAAPITNADAINEFALSLSTFTETATGTQFPRRVWPAARTSNVNPDDTTPKPYGGTLAIGALGVTKDTNNFPNFMALLMTFGHELTHTQDLSYNRFMEYRVFRYGADGKHYFTEAIPSMASSYKEGLANFVGWSLVRRNMDQVAAWFGTDGYVLVEKPPNPKPAGYLPPDVFNYDTLDKTKMETGLTFSDPNIAANYGVWKLSNLPPRVIIHNEQIIALILYSRATSTPNGFQEVMASFKSMNPRTFRVSTSAWAQMIDQLGSDMLQFSNDRQKVGTQSVGRAMLPMALVDYFTNFKLQNEAEMAEILENHLYIKDWVKGYWIEAKSNVRDEVTKWKAANPAPTGLTGDAYKTAMAKRQADIVKVIAQTLNVK
jgi:hypothetical protein